LQNFTKSSQVDGSTAPLQDGVVEVTVVVVEIVLVVMVVVLVAVVVVLIDVVLVNVTVVAVAVVSGSLLPLSPLLPDSLPLPEASVPLPLTKTVVVVVVSAKATARTGLPFTLTKTSSRERASNASVLAFSDRSWKVTTMLPQLASTRTMSDASKTFAAINDALASAFTCSNSSALQSVYKINETACRTVVVVVDVVVDVVGTHWLHVIGQARSMSCSPQSTARSAQTDGSGRPLHTGVVVVVNVCVVVLSVAVVDDAVVVVVLVTVVVVVEVLVIVVVVDVVTQLSHITGQVLFTAGLSLQRS
jgi:hypothetical protein